MAKRKALSLCFSIEIVTYENSALDKNSNSPTFGLLHIWDPLWKDNICVLDIVPLESDFVIQVDMSGISQTYRQPRSACTGDKQRRIVSLVAQATQPWNMSQTCVLEILLI